MPEERRMSLSMTLPQLKIQLKNVRDDFLFFGIFQKNTLMAASISVRVSNRILYDFYHAHSKSADRLSPVVALIDGMYHYCVKTNLSCWTWELRQLINKLILACDKIMDWQSSTMRYLRMN